MKTRPRFALRNIAGRDSVRGMDAVNRAIRAELAAREVTQAGLAAALGIPQSQVSARLRGVIDWRLSELYTVAARLGVTLADLICNKAA